MGLSSVSVHPPHPLVHCTLLLLLWSHRGWASRPVPQSEGASGRRKTLAPTLNITNITSHPPTRAHGMHRDPKINPTHTTHTTHHTHRAPPQHGARHKKKKTAGRSPRPRRPRFVLRPCQCLHHKGSSSSMGPGGARQRHCCGQARVLGPPAGPRGLWLRRPAGQDQGRRHAPNGRPGLLGLDGTSSSLNDL